MKDGVAHALRALPLAATENSLRWSDPMAEQPSPGR